MDEQPKPEPGCEPEDHPRLNPPPLDQAAVQRASRLFRALGDPARLRLAARLAESGSCVTELASAEGEELSTISQRLRILRSENIVVGKRRGKHIDYALADRHISQLVLDALAHSNEEKEETDYE
jgi:ArsR family transcriptional regulator, lead/cadmium/zinc/bismuth-responsive transcriptional repressor